MDTFVVENVLFQEVTVLLKLYITMSTIISVKHNVANVCKYRQRVLFRKTTILFLNYRRSQEARLKDRGRWKRAMAHFQKDTIKG